MIDTVFVLAGGSGTRLWPASTKSSPKQFLPIDDKTLLERTLERAFSLTDKGEVYIITIADQLEATVSLCASAEYSTERLKLIPEPVSRNTAPAIALAARHLQLEGRGEERVLVLAADHLIEPYDAFENDVEAASELAADDYLVTFGIPPVRAETGFGYIEAGEAYRRGYKVRSFREKPDRQTAESYLEAGNYYWNSGMFAFGIDVFLNELQLHASELASLFDTLSESPGSRKEKRLEVLLEDEAVQDLYNKAPKISIDYAVMERSNRVAMVPASFNWNDVGSWDELAAQIGADTSPEGYSGKAPSVVAVDSDDNFVYSDIPVALCGVDDLIVVAHEGKLLVCKRGASQEVKQIVETLKERDQDELL